MEFTSITSSNLKGAAMDGTDLYLEFNNGGVYRYAEVPKKVFDDLLVAESAGKFFHAEIKPKFVATKIDTFSV